MVSVIIPAYNEQNRIAKALDALTDFMEGAFSEQDYEILVVDDGSRDATKDVVRAYGSKNVSLLTYENNRGKGGAVKYGVENAKGDIIIFTDADLPYPPESIKKAVEIFEKEQFELILGSRVISEQGKRYPWYRTIMSHTFSMLVDAVLKLHVPDTQCGFKCFRRNAAKNIFEKSTLVGWGFDVELIFIAKKMGYSIGRIPVHLSHENDGSKIRVFNATKTMIREVLCVRKNNKNGLYD